NISRRFDLAPRFVMAPLHRQVFSCRVAGDRAEIMGLSDDLARSRVRFSMQLFGGEVVTPCTHEVSSGVKEEQPSRAVLFVGSFEQRHMGVGGGEGVVEAIEI